MDRDFAHPLDVVSLAAIACVRVELHPIVRSDVRGDTTPLPAATPDRARDVAWLSLDEELAGR